MGVVAKDVVSAWQQVVCLDELVNRMTKRHGGYYHTKQNITTECLLSNLTGQRICTKLSQFSCAVMITLSYFYYLSQEVKGHLPVHCTICISIFP